MEDDPLVKGGCGHSDGECQFSAMAAGVCLLLPFAVGIIALIFR